MQNRHTRRAPSVQNIFGLFLDTPTERSVVKMTDVLRTRFKEETDRCIQVCPGVVGWGGEGINTNFQ